MTEEFTKRLTEIIEKKAKDFKTENQKNKKYIELYTNLVLSFIETYDFKTDSFKFDSEKIIAEYGEIIGNPDKIIAYDYTKDNEGVLKFHYKRDNTCALIGYPNSLYFKEYDFKLLNEILCENGISVKEDLWDGGNLGSDEIIVKFDSTLLNETRKSLKESTKKMLLTNNNNGDTNNN